MIDAFGRLPGLSALSMIGMGGMQMSPLMGLAGFANGLVGPSTGSWGSNPYQSVQVSAGLSGYLGSGQVGSSAYAYANQGVAYAAAASPGQATGARAVMMRPAPENVAAYREEWARMHPSYGRGSWHSVGGRFHGPEGGHGYCRCRHVLGTQTGTSQQSSVVNTFQKVPEVANDSQWPAASKVMATRVVGSAAGQQRIHFGGENPWTNRDGAFEERLSVWHVMQQDNSLRYDADRHTFFRTNTDGSTRDVATIDDVQNVRRQARGNLGQEHALIGQYVQGLNARTGGVLYAANNGNGNGNGGGVADPPSGTIPADPNGPGVPATPANPGGGNGNGGVNPPGAITSPPGQPPGTPTNPSNPGTGTGTGTGYYPTLPDWNDPGWSLPTWTPPSYYSNPPMPPVNMPGSYTDGGSSIPGSYTGGNLTTGIPGVYTGGGNPNAGIPSSYLNNGSPNSGIPASYLANGNPNDGIPAMYLNNGSPNWGIPGMYQMNGSPNWGIPGPYQMNGSPNWGIPGPYQMNGNPGAGIPWPYPGVNLAGMGGPFPYGYGYF